MNAQDIIDTAMALVADDKGLQVMDESNPTCNKRFARLGILPRPKWPMCWQHSKLYVTELCAIELRAVANTMPRWKGHEHDKRGA